MRAIKLLALMISGFPTSFVVAVAISLLATILMRSDQRVFAQGTVGKTKELILAPTEVGSPVGNKVTKDIGPAGGTLSSSDGRMTLTVPPNAVQETVPFSIQPITNKATNGLGNAYRLEPDGKTFTTPVNISVRYDDKDLEGTVPEALSMAYQGEKGAWHAQRSAKLDQSAKTISFATTHFTDVTAWSRLMLRPVQARVPVGRSQPIRLVRCPEPGLIDQLLSQSVDCSGLSPNATVDWQLQGAGSLEDTNIASVTNYRAPARKPADNIAMVHVETRFSVWDPQTGETSVVEKTLIAKMIIVNVGYKAIGGTGGLTFSGVVCSLAEPFTIKGASMLNYTFKFTPSSPNTGSFTYTVSGAGFTAKSSGSYTVDGIDTDKPKIVIPPSQATGTWRTLPSSPTFRLPSIELEPLDTPECG